MTIAYLDPDDEITSAVARLRASEEIRVVLVLPLGSRIATSRINFRLLAREAREHQRRLSIVAGEPSVRAVAISAGLPAYGTVAEYEAALEEARTAGGPGAGAAVSASPEGGTAAGSPAAGPAVAGAGSAKRAGRGAAVAGTTGAAAEGAAAAAVTATGAATGEAAPAGVEAAGAAGIDEAAATATIDTGAVRRAASQAIPVVPPRALGGVGQRVGIWALASLGLLAAIVLVVLAGLLVLPSATITVVPRTEGAGPVKLTVTIDPGATAVDTATGVVPAQTVTLPLTATSEFQATGKKVTETKATGTITFTNCNNNRSVTVPASTIVGTTSGVQFATTVGAVVPKAGKNGCLSARTANAPIVALKAGTAGNVPAGSITQVSASLQVLLVNPDNPVDNGSPTSGGTHTETPQVAQKDYDDATKTLSASLKAQLDGAAANPATAPAGTTLIPATATLGPTAADPQASAVVGKEQPTFELTVNATGTVNAVDQAQLEQVATERLKSEVPAGYQLFEDSVKPTVGTATVGGGKISAPVEARGEMAKTLDSTALLAQVKGKSVAEAQTILAPFGTVTIETWPFYVGSIPTLDGRATLTVSPPQRSGT